MDAKGWIPFLIVVVLSGCTGAPPGDGSPDADDAMIDSSSPGVAAENRTKFDPATGERVPLEPLVFLDGTFPWTDAEAEGALPAAYRAAGHVVMHMCIGDPVTPPYMTNLRLTGALENRSLAPGYSRLEVSLDWEVQDYIEDRLVLAYRPPGVAHYTETEYIPRGESFTLPVEPDWNGDHAIGWDLWLCKSRGGDFFALSPDYTPAPFVGSVTVKIMALP